MQKAIDAIFENGVFKPKKKVAIPERTKLKLIVLEEDNNESVLLARKQSNSLLSVAGIGASGLKDVSENPDKYLYGWNGLK